jgi:hypothetical protein
MAVHRSCPAQALASSGWLFCAWSGAALTVSGLVPVRRARIENATDRRARIENATDRRGRIRHANPTS